jgi:KaiC/GvpD/RAD55 family RecA-like ATPase
MKSMTYLKELLVNMNRNVSLVLLNQKQFRSAIDFVLQSILEKDTHVIFVSLTASGEEIIEKFNNPNLVVIDGFSEEKSDTEKIISIGNKNSLTRIQIAIEKASEEKKPLIIFDSLSVLSIYNPKDLAKFIYLFNNKLNLNDNTCIYFATKESIDEGTIETTRQFCDKFYDFSGIYISSIHV